MTSGTDDQIIATMSGLDENANRLRKSLPYVGLINPDTRRKLIKQAGFELPSTTAAAKAGHVLAELAEEFAAAKDSPNM